MMRKGRGFTLIELLVVVSIIAILVAIGVAVFGDVQKKARDVHRKEDMVAVQKAFEQYFEENDAFPLSIGAASAYFSLARGVPEDPKNTGSFVYTCTCTATAYSVCATLEVGGTFCVDNLQE